MRRKGKKRVKKDPPPVVPQLQPGQTIVGVGVDLGFTNMGATKVTLTYGHEPAVFDGRLIRTKKRADAHRVSLDNTARAEKIWNELYEFAKGADFLAYEVYTPFSGAGRGGSGSKVATAAGLAMGVGFALGIPVIPVLPVDVKKAALGSHKGSKEDVQAALARIDGATAVIESVARTKREHLADAIGVALAELIKRGELGESQPETAKAA